MFRLIVFMRNGIAWERQKGKDWTQVPNLASIKSMAQKISELRTRALFVVLYLTATRLNEVCKKLRKKDIEFETINGKEVVIFRLTNLKNRTTKLKSNAIPLRQESELVKILKEYIELLGPEDLLFDFGSRRAEQLIAEEIDWNCHWIRHCRLSHLVIYYQFDGILLMKFAGWSDLRMADRYLQLSVSAQVDKY